MELAQAMVMDRTTLVRILQPLLRDGFVADGQDRRVRQRLQLVLTSGGHMKLHEAMAHWTAAQDEFERKFGSQQSASLRHELLRVTREASKTRGTTERQDGKAINPSVSKHPF